MIQTWRFPLILGLSVLFGMPALGDLVLQPQRLLSAGMSYLGALGLSWLGVNGIFSLVNYYAAYNERMQEKQRVEGLAHSLLRGAGTPEPARSAPQPVPNASAPVAPRPAAAAPAAPTPDSAATNAETTRRPVARDLLAEDEAVGAAI